MQSLITFYAQQTVALVVAQLFHDRSFTMISPPILRHRGAWMSIR